MVRTYHLIAFTPEGEGTATSARRPSDGFTLIELCIALFVALALFTLAAGIMRIGMKEGDLARLRDETGLLARQVRALAMQSGRTQELGIVSDVLELEVSGDASPPIRPVRVPPGTKLEVQVWPDDRWLVPEKKINWLFQPNGICTPMSFRFSEGASFVSFRIHPLTGAIDQESRVIERKP